jgi:hypothetical protein
MIEDGKPRSARPLNYRQDAEDTHAERAYRFANPWTVWTDPYGIHRQAQRSTLRQDEDSAPPAQGAEHARLRYLARLKGEPLPPPPPRPAYREDTTGLAARPAGCCRPGNHRHRPAGRPP